MLTFKIKYKHTKGNLNPTYTQIKELPTSRLCALCISLCTVIIHITARSSSDYFPRSLQTVIVAQMLSTGGRGYSVGLDSGIGRSVLDPRSTAVCCCSVCTCGNRSCEFVDFLLSTTLCLQYFDAVGWAVGRASGL